MTELKLEETNIVLLRILWVLNLLFHQVLAITTFYLFYILFENNQYENKMLWHAFLSIFAYLPLMAEGLVLFTEANVWTLKMSRTTKGYIHGFVLLFSLISVTIGIVLAIERKNETNSDHFVTDHAKLGLASWILCFISSAFGLLVVCSRFKQLIPPVYFKLFHTLIGLAAFVTGIASLILGLNKGMFYNHVSSGNMKATLNCVIAITISCGIEAIIAICTHIRSIFGF